MACLRGLNPVSWKIHLISPYNLKSMTAYPLEFGTAFLEVGRKSKKLDENSFDFKTFGWVEVGPLESPLGLLQEEMRWFAGSDLFLSADIKSKSVFDKKKEYCFRW